MSEQQIDKDKMKIKSQRMLSIMFLSFALLIISILNYAGVYGQEQNMNNTSSFQTRVNFVDNLPAQKIRVADIDIAYKQLGKGMPVVLITGYRATMDMCNPLLLKQLSLNHTLIIFDNRGAGNTTAGTNRFSIGQFANDTAGLLDALNIEKADIMGWSMSSYIALELALKHPNKVNSIILYGSGCGGKESIPPSPEVTQTLSNTSSTQEEQEKRLISLLFPSSWFKANPNYLNYFPIPKESVSPEIAQKQAEAIMNWNGVCDTVSKITQPALVIVGTDDLFTPASNSLTLIEQIPEAWLVQIRDAGHGLMYQFPDKFSRIVMTVLESQ
jgi:pimeloyl-ACP methyl ester carboxylesterase